MPPRSVCLNVFTSSLGNDIGLGKERDVHMEVREVEDKMEGVEHTAERGRHDSVQGSPNDSIVATHSYNEPIANSPQPSPSLTMNDNIPEVPKSSLASRDRNLSTPGMNPTKCSTCGNGPAPGSSLSRCSRCKNVFYCSKSCQKAAWRSHKFDCEPSGSLRGFSPSSAMNTPDISTPASPVAHDSASEPAIMRNLSAGDAVPTQPAETGVYRFPQNSEDWRRNYDKYTSTLEITGMTMLGAVLGNAYTLYALENGGLPSAWDVTQVEYRAYLDAVDERVELPLVLNDGNKAELVEQMRQKFELFQESCESTWPSFVEEFPQSSLVAECRRINEAVYGPNESEKPVSR